MAVKVTHCSSVYMPFEPICKVLSFKRTYLFERNKKSTPSGVSLSFADILKFILLWHSKSTSGNLTLRNDLKAKK